MKISKKWKIIWIAIVMLMVVSSASLGVSFAESIRLQKTQEQNSSVDHIQNHDRSSGKID